MQELALVTFGALLLFLQWKIMGAHIRNLEDEIELLKKERRNDNTH